MTDDVSKSGYVAIVGRPNVGKSTLLNHILKQKISITSRKPQTTRHQILGIKTEGSVQTAYVDTPGLHKNAPKAINRYMNRVAHSALQDVDVVIFVVDRIEWTDDDEMVLDKVQNLPCPVMLVVNKVDWIKEKNTLLPHIEFLAKKHSFKEIIPISALEGTNIEKLENLIVEELPQGPHLFPEDQVTDRSERFMVAEMIREKVMRQLGQELPYALTVEIEEFKQTGKVWHINALILVEREGQKRIVIGKNGARLKSIGTEARKDMEVLLDSKVMLRLWAKVKSGWADDDRALRSLGYDDI
ncbi:MAG: GTPase Era [Pseudomonadales bacterium]|nr:GTPase Era [Pseudomonadales bacterium]